MPLVQAMEINPAMANAASIALVWRRVDAVMAVSLLESVLRQLLRFPNCMTPSDTIPAKTFFDSLSGFLIQGKVDC